jgi:LacI family transcriptional regulator
VRKNIKDIAKQAKVSIATVSRVINDSKPVSVELRKRVGEAIEANNFKPNPMARGLVTQRTEIIGIILPNIGNEVFGNLVRGVNDIVTSHGYTLMVCDSGGDKANELRLLDTMTDKRADGVIFAGVHLDRDLVEDMKRRGFAVVLVSQAPADGCEDLDVVILDNTKAVREGMEFLMSRGHRRIAFIAGPERDYSSGTLRLNGYREALAAAGIPIDPGLIRHGDFSYKSGYAAMSAIVSSTAERPTAVFAASDVMATGAMNFLYDRGLRVPEEVSVMGLDDSPIAECTRPALTTIRVSYFDEGITAAETLLDIIEGKPRTPEFHFVPHEIISRGSVLTVDAR